LADGAQTSLGSLFVLASAGQEIPALSEKLQ
jgi:hypothetical protein